MKIANIESLQILDSRGNPTIQVEVVLQDGSKGIFQVPSGASTGIHEALELRDGNKNVYHGKGVEKAISNVYSVKSHLLNKEFTQEELDRELIRLDGTPNKSKLGANAILGVSIAFARATAVSQNKPLYQYLSEIVDAKRIIDKKKKDTFKPFAVLDQKEHTHLFVNVINGGQHSGNALNIQEFMLVPIFGTLQDKVRAVSEIYHALKKIIAEKYGKDQTGVGDEGGFAPNIAKATEALDLLVEAIKKMNYEGKVALALDAAASDFYDASTGLYEVEEGLKLDHKQLTDYWNKLAQKYPLISFEDPMAEDDFEGFAYFKQNITKLKMTNPLNGTNMPLIVGDDLLVTNPARVKLAKDKNLCSALLLKINQIGTLTESIEAHQLAQSFGWHTIVSHRSGEASDSFISDLCVAMRGSIKLGAPCRGERVAKFNRLLEIFR